MAEAPWLSLERLDHHLGGDRREVRHIRLGGRARMSRHRGGAHVCSAKWVRRYHPVVVESRPSILARADRRLGTGLVAALQRSAAGAGQLDVVRYLSLTWHWNGEVWGDLARGGHVDALRWGVDNGHDFWSNISELAASGGDLDTLGI